MGRWVNGSVGRITDIVQYPGEEAVIVVGLADGEEVEVMPNTWEIFRFFSEDDKLKSEGHREVHSISLDCWLGR
jgi:hypothetical protein